LIYIYEFTIKDKAGNVTEATYLFRVDENGRIIVEIEKDAGFYVYDYTEYDKNYDDSLDVSTTKEMGIIWLMPKVGTNINNADPIMIKVTGKDLAKISYTINEKGSFLSGEIKEVEAESKTVHYLGITDDIKSILGDDYANKNLVITVVAEDTTGYTSNAYFYLSTNEEGIITMDRDGGCFYYEDITLDFKLNSPKDGDKVSTLKDLSANISTIFSELKSVVYTIKVDGTIVKQREEVQLKEGAFSGKLEEIGMFESLVDRFDKIEIWVVAEEAKGIKQAYYLITPDRVQDKVTVKEVVEILSVTLPEVAN